MERIDHWRSWIGRTEHRVDQVRAGPVAALAVTLDQAAAEPPPGGDLPPLRHWLYFTPLTRTGEIDGDGRTPDGLSPSVPAAHRACAGGRVWFHQPLRIDDEITRVSRIVDVSAIGDAGGPAVLVTVRHEITNALGLAITEEEEIVYGTAAGAAAAPGAVPPDGAAKLHSRMVTPTPVLLFRYSALTFNGHRIHYDRSYATGPAGHPGLVVQAPLLALLLLDDLRQQERSAAVRSFAFQAIKPVFDTGPFELCQRTEPAAGSARRATLWVRDREGVVAMHAHAELIDASPDGAS